ncbi:MAG: MgtC/SapB family protein [Lachnospiraceae bacterium]|nr:MgtC/SapB family protein [Lachnospiraceae bacterium]
MFAYLKEFNFVSVLFRLLLAMLGGGIMGFGRSKKARSAGFRTYMLISIGAALSVLLTLYYYAMLHGPWQEALARVGEKFDASRLGAAVITGIGFLGAGTIIKSAHQQVNGLTTATGMFATVCIGIAAGCGFYECAIPAIVIAALVLNPMSPLEVEFKRKLRNISMTVEFESIEDIDKINNVIKEHEAKVYDIDIERFEKEKNKFPSAIFILQMSKNNRSHSAMLSSIAELPCVRSVHELIA